MATSSGIGDEVASFIDRCISSVATLEVLLFLRAAESAVLGRDLPRKMAFEPSMAERAVRELADRGLVEVDDSGAVAFRPARASDASAIDSLAGLYRTRRIAVITQIIRDRPAADKGGP